MRVTMLLVALLGAGVAGCASDDDATVASVPSTVAAAPTAAVGDPELRAELLAMLAEDQAVRTGVAPPGDDRTADELFAAMDAVDAANTARVVEIFDAHGWPGWDLVGEDGSTAAWAIVQHADLRPDVQRRGLELLRTAVAAGDASPGDLAYLEDRVLVAAGEPQVYGTQWQTDATGSLVPRTPIADPAAVDERRARAGLATIAEYLEELETAFAAAADDTRLTAAGAPAKTSRSGCRSCRRRHDLHPDRHWRDSRPERAGATTGPAASRLALTSRALRPPRRSNEATGTGRRTMASWPADRSRRSPRPADASYRVRSAAARCSTSLRAVRLKM